MVDIYCVSYSEPPAAVTLDIDETGDVVHGGQQLSSWNGHYEERCILPIHVYDTETGRPVAMLLRTGKTPSGTEMARQIRRLIRRIRRHWPNTAITLRGDGHYGRPEIMAWCEANGIDYVFGLPGNRMLHADPVIVRKSPIEAAPTGKLAFVRRGGAMLFRWAAMLSIEQNCRNFLHFEYEPITIALKTRACGLWLETCKTFNVPFFWRP